MKNTFSYGISSVLAFVIILAVAFVVFGGAYYYKMSELSDANLIVMGQQPIRPPVKTPATSTQVLPVN